MIGVPVSRKWDNASHLAWLQLGALHRAMNRARDPCLSTPALAWASVRNSCARRSTGLRAPLLVRNQGSAAIGRQVRNHNYAVHRRLQGNFGLAVLYQRRGV